MVHCTWFIDGARPAARTTAAHGAVYLLTASLSLVGCQSSVGERSSRASAARAATDLADAGLAGPGGSPTPSEPIDGAPPQETEPPRVMDPPPATGPSINAIGTAPMPPACRDTSDRAQEILADHCGGCHSDQVDAKGDFSTILDVPQLVGDGKLVEYEPDASLILQRIVGGSMPPATVDRRPQNDEIDALELWIACGAPDWKNESFESPSFVTIDARLSAIDADLSSITNPSERARIRYLDFSHLRNAGHSPDQLEMYRQATWLLLNSLSRGDTPLVPTAVDEDRLIYRFDLRDYLWDEQTWAQLEAEYPYAAVYDQDSRLFPVDERTAEQIREETATTIPVIQADWFLSHASRPPLYFSLLEIPQNFRELERQLGVDTDDNIADEQVFRAGFLESDPSLNNRMIERHDLGGNRGALWRSYDFANSQDFSNIFAHPVDFREDGSSVIFTLPNGLQGYFLMDEDGDRLAKAPTDIVRDPAARDGAVETGISCIGCHQSEGVIPRFDEIRDFQLNAGSSAQEIEQVLALYASRQDLEDVFEADQDRYQEALAALGINVLTDTSMHALDATHQGLLDLETAGAIVGITAEELKRAIDASPQSFPAEIVTLRANGGSIQRDAFDAIVGDLVEALGLGEQLLGVNRGRDDDDDDDEVFDPEDDDNGDALVDEDDNDNDDNEQQDEDEQQDLGEEEENERVDEAPPERIQCQNADSCDEACGAQCALTCRDLRDCAPEVGPNSAVVCERVGNCAPTCNGACVVRCSNVGNCDVNCSQGQAVNCGNGFKVCGRPCPQPR